MAVVKKFDELVKICVAANASDLYVLPTQLGFVVRYVAGTKLHHLKDVSLQEGNHLIQHVKYRSEMDISDARRPQLGRMRYVIDQRVVHCRISSVGDFLNRQSLVVRFIYEAQDITLRWTDEGAVERFYQTVISHNGLILLSGAMGSGKTTTMYYVAQKVAYHKFVLTIEDPVEIATDRFLQLQVNDFAGMSYASLLKLALRHHPDIMIVGEIRDADTARIVVEAALSGHLIISTVHATSMVGIWYRMLSFGIDPEVLKHVLSGIGNQSIRADDAGSLVDFRFLTKVAIEEMIDRVEA